MKEPKAIPIEGPGGLPSTRVSSLVYDLESLQQREDVGLAEIVGAPSPPATTWVHVAGLRDADAVRHILSAFGVHPLALEDILDDDARPGLDDHGGSYVIGIDWLAGDPGSPRGMPVRIVLGEAYVLTFIDSMEDPFGGVRARIREGRFRIRSSGAGFLAYSLLDAVVDSYFPVLDRYARRIEGLEIEASRATSRRTSEAIQELKREIIHLSHLAWSAGELLTHLARVGRRLVSKETRPYLREVRDHARRVEEMLENYRDLADGLHDTYISSLNLRSNEVMKALTLIATIFLPLNFVASFYGMNFKYMPELEWQGGYFISIALMIAIVAIMLLWFRRKRWL
jgi:magnesium transporter